MKKLNFEQSMERLETIVRLLERGDAPLEDSLKLFEEGSRLIAGCIGLLDKAEQTVRQLTGEAEGQPVLSEFSAGDEA